MSGVGIDLLMASRNKRHPINLGKIVKPVAHTTGRVMAVCKCCHGTTGRHKKGENVIVIICSRCWESGFR